MTSDEGVLFKWSILSQCLYNGQKIKTNAIKITMSGSWAESVAAITVY